MFLQKTEMGNAIPGVSAEQLTEIQNLYNIANQLAASQEIKEFIEKTKLTPEKIISVGYDIKSETAGISSDTAQTLSDVLTTLSNGKQHISPDMIQNLAAVSGAKPLLRNAVKDLIKSGGSIENVKSLSGLIQVAKFAGIGFA